MAAATAADSTTTVAATAAPTFTMLASFNGTDGANPFAGLIADAAGDLFGTTAEGGTSNDGTVFEIAKTGSGYASTPTTLVSFNCTNGCRSDRRRRRGPLRHDMGWRCEQRWHGVRDRQGRRQLRQRADHTGHLQRHRWGKPVCGSDRRRRRGPLRHDMGWRDERRWHSVRDRQDRHRLRQHTDHAGQLQLHQRVWPVCRSDRRRRRGPLRHDTVGWAERRRHGVRRSSRLAAATPARPPFWSASTAPTAVRLSRV